MIDSILSTFSPLGMIENLGGGGYNTFDHLLHAGRCPAYVDASLLHHDAGPRTLFLGLRPPPRNVIVTLSGEEDPQRRHDRIILKESLPQIRLNPRDIDAVRCFLLRQSSHLILNSLKDEDLATAAIETGLPLLTVVTTSLPAYFVTRELLCRGPVIFNADEISHVAGPDPGQGGLRAILEAITRLERRAPLGAAFVTRGSRGVVVRHEDGRIAGIRLHPGLLREISSALGKDTCGAGDSFAAGVGESWSRGEGNAADWARAGCIAALRRLGVEHAFDARAFLTRTLRPAPAPERLCVWCHSRLDENGWCLRSPSCP